MDFFSFQLIYFIVIIVFFFFFSFSRFKRSPHVQLNVAWVWVGSHGVMGGMLTSKLNMPITAMQIISVGEIRCAHKPDILAWFLYNCRKWWGPSIFVSCQWCVHYPSFISQHRYSHRFHHHPWSYFHTEVAGGRHPRLPFFKKMTSHTGDEVAVAWSLHIVERNQKRVRDFKSQDEEKLRAGWMENPDEGLSFLPHRLLMMPNLQYLNTSALMIFQFYRYGQRMWLDENVKWNYRKMREMGAAVYFITINQTWTLKKLKRLWCFWFKGTVGLW